MRVMAKHGADIGTGSFTIYRLLYQIKNKILMAHHFMGMNRIFSTISCKLILSLKRKVFERGSYYNTLNNYYRDIILFTLSLSGIIAIFKHSITYMYIL